MISLFIAIATGLGFALFFSGDQCHPNNGTFAAFEPAAIVLMIGIGVLAIAYKNAVAIIKLGTRWSASRGTDKGGRREKPANSDDNDKFFHGFEFLC